MHYNLKHLMGGFQLKFLTFVIPTLVLLCASEAKYSYFNPPRIHHEKAFPINPNVFFPCLHKVCDKEFGCFEPFTLNNFILTPPLAGCPEIKRKRTLRFLTISRNKAYKYQSAKIIKKNSKVAMLVHGAVEEYNTIDGVLVAIALLKTHDFVVVADRSYLSDPYVVGHTFNPVLSLLAALVNNILVGRITCKFTHLLIKERKIDEKSLRVVGFSAGAGGLAEMCQYCKAKYGQIFNQVTAVEMSAVPNRYNNYPLLNYTDAKYVDLIHTTVEPYLYKFEILAVLALRLGAFESIGTCVYNFNPAGLLTVQPGCEGIAPCSHLFSQFIFAAAVSGRCRYRYGPCPIESLNSSSEVGYTSLDCSEHPQLFMTCINTTSEPLISC